MTTRTKNNTLAEIAESLQNLDRVAVTTHVGADGDAIGASAALVCLMRRLGATAVFCHAEGVPEYLAWLLPDEALRELPPDHDLLVADTSRADRTGVPVPEAGARLNVDHHEDNPLYAEYNLVNPRAAATVENSDYERTGATELDSKESIDQLRTVAGVDVVAHLREVPQGTKGSLRSETVDVGEIARHFGGGGHRLAAGYTTPRRPDEAREELLEILEGVLDIGGER